MAQSEIQSLIQSLAGTHSAGQSNLPGAVNNGNPNTVYNTAPGYTPPVSDAFDTWRLSQPALPTRDTSSIVGDPIAHANKFFQQSGTQLPAPVTRAPWTPPTGAGGATAPLPVFGNWNGNVGGGGLSTPPVIGTPGTGVIGTPSINLPEPPVQVGGGGVAPPAPTPVSGSIGSDLYNSLFRDPLQQGVSPIMGGAQSSTGGGNLSWQQLLDMVSEPFLPGDMYLSGTNQWDLSNIGEALLSSLSGLPVESSLDLLTGMYAGKDADGYYQNLENAPQYLQDRYLDNLNNLLANTQSSSISNTTNKLNKSIEQTLSQKLMEDLAKRGMDTSSDAAAARKEAEAKQAREFVEGYTSMPANMQRSAQQARAAMDRMFGGKER